MSSNTIARRIFDFLKDIPPFTFVDEEALLRIASRVEVQYQPQGSVIFDRGHQPRHRFFVLKQGAVELLKPLAPDEEDDEEEQLVERCGEGEVFGIRPLLAQEEYSLRARAAEDSLLYAINTEGFREVLERYPEVLHYLANSMAATGKREVEYGLYPTNNNQTGGARTDINPTTTTDLLELQSIQRAREPLTCSPDTQISEAAELMTEEDEEAIIIVDEQQHPLGILTDRDIRRNVATGLYGRKRPISEVMTQPVVCIRPEVTVADIQIAMLRYDIHHVVVTEDGTNDSPVIGLITEHDLLVRQGNNPAILIHEIRRAKDPIYLEELRFRAEQLLVQYLDQEVSIGFISTIMTEINDEIIQRCLSLSLTELRKKGQGGPPCNFAYLSLGSQGRGEQLLRTDQDSGLIYADQANEEKSEEVHAYFLELAQLVTAKLATAGFAYCPGNMMASNPQWCQPLEQWKAHFGRWMSEPKAEHLLNSSIFFDYRTVYGDTSLAEQLTDFIFQRLEDSRIFLTFLARAALQNPAPLTFFRNFMVERSGEHKNQFDLKARAMMPLTDAARVLVLEARQGKINNSFRRFEFMAEKEPQNAELYQEAAKAYEYLIRLRALIGLQRKDNGRFIEPKELTRLQRILLRNTFTPVKEIQSLLEIRFQLKMIR